MSCNKWTMEVSVITLFICVMLIGCKPGVPGEYIQPSKLENILYEYHLSEGIVNQNVNVNDRAVELRAYQLSVLQKYGVTQSDFDSSMAYYIRHTDLLHDIYKDLTKRMTNEAASLGASANGIANNNYSAKGDTANVWNDAKSLVLIPKAPFNLSSYYIKVDSTFHKGDMITLSLGAQFIYQDGMRDGVAMLAVRFANDSVASQVLHMSSPSVYTVQVRDDKHLGIKEIRGFFFLNSNAFMSNASSMTTLQIMFLQNIRLLKIHEKKGNNANIAKPDSIRRDSALKQNGRTLPPPNNSQLRPTVSSAPPIRMVKGAMSSQKSNNK